MDFDLENPLTALQEHQLLDTIPVLFASESDHMPCENFIQILRTRDFDTSIRREAISMILQFSSNLDPLISYLAIIYLDRFISSRNEMQQDKPWFFRLLAVSCISLAAKMKKKTEFSLTNFQREEGFIFDSQTIQRTELVILGTLNWRMHTITPFSFVHFFVSMFKLKDPPLRQALRARATEIIFKSLHDEINLLAFKPSIIAASALLSASHELFPLQFPCFSKAFSSCAYVKKEKLLECFKVMQEIVMNEYDSVFDRVSRSDTPVNVLDRQTTIDCLSS
ncbi:Cyclin [Macleaya cordata]|uniref:Cyclin n=1 Tax=Macleaya cordata TaxID=56857 RepID=A0A200Q8F1_MACCD|nr:Cyclin [Macleaya cordata]